MIPQFNTLFCDSSVLLVLKEVVIPTLGARGNSKYVIDWLHSVDKIRAFLTDMKYVLIGNVNTMSRKKATTD